MEMFIHGNIITSCVYITHIHIYILYINAETLVPNHLKNILYNIRRTLHTLVDCTSPAALCADGGRVKYAALLFYYLLPTDVYVLIFLCVLIEKSGFFVYVPLLHMFTSHDADAWCSRVYIVIVTYIYI